MATAIAGPLSEFSGFADQQPSTQLTGVSGAVIKIRLKKPKQNYPKHVIQLI